MSIGVLEGCASLVNTVAKVLSGVTSDVCKSRSRVIAIGSLLTAFVKFIFASATGVQHIFIGKCMDRLAKGIRMAPTDALLSDLSPPADRSRTYGMYQSMMTLGAMCGATWASVCMVLTNNNYRFTFAAAAIPALFATALLE
eukprot:CAMPEP_0118922390 /NCGR_PEP_ID=MMETSP1169-20130426/1336_1 /TAXON_ID=36882 /ORGANISM="Pyramimonas obovata, Strain CCMP722" /LENGTH=141 /DNA_ID=CAMNT_0006863249 /DNA_START=543 /DNA_END=965 /DNA_ORIENTATION=-